MTAPRLLSINNYYYRRGGAEVVFLEHNRMFAEDGWDVTPFAMKHPKNLPAPSQDQFVDEIEFGSQYGLAGNLRRGAKIVYSFEARRKIREIVAAKRPDIAHAHNIYHHISPSIFPELKAAGVPTVMTVHDMKLACPAYTMRVGGEVCERCRGGHIYNVVANRCIKGSLALSGLVMVETAVHRMLGLYSRHVDRFVVPSRFVLEKLVDWGWPRERFVHIPNVVEAERFTPASEAGKGFLYFGRLAPEKGLDVLIRAGAKAKVPIILVGTGPEEQSLKALAASLGADVNFLGYRTGEDLFGIVRNARAVVMPSTWYENAPLTILESYALGRPVIGAGIGGIPEMIRDGETGAIVPPGDVSHLADTLGRFAALSSNETIRMGIVGRRWVETDFSPKAYKLQMRGLYRSLIGDREYDRAATPQ
jgi:glycosyltransferase involved in cell wall biosynthesis